MLIKKNYLAIYCVLLTKQLSHGAQIYKDYEHFQHIHCCLSQLLMCKFNKIFC